MSKNTTTAAAITTTNAKPSKRTVCALTATEFKSHAKALPITIGERSMLIPVKEFSTGSFGWYTSEKTTAIVDGKPVTVQFSVQMVVVGSKDAGR